MKTYSIFKSTRLAPHLTRRGITALYFVQTSDGEVLASFHTEDEAKAKIAELEAA